MKSKEDIFADLYGKALQDKKLEAEKESPKIFGIDQVTRNF